MSSHISNFLKGFENPCEFCRTDYEINGDEALKLILEEGLPQKYKLIFDSLHNFTSNYEVVDFIEEHKNHHDPCTFYSMIDGFFREGVEKDGILCDWITEYVYNYRALYKRGLTPGDDLMSSKQHMSKLWDLGFEHVLYLIESKTMLSDIENFHEKFKFNDLKNALIMIKKVREGFDSAEEKKIISVTMAVNESKETDLGFMVSVGEDDVFSKFSKKLKNRCMRLHFSINGEDACDLNEEQIRMIKIAIGEKNAASRFNGIKICDDDRQLFEILTTSSEDELGEYLQEYRFIEEDDY